MTHAHNPDEANLLGALAIALGDELRAATDRAAERGATAPAAIVALSGYLPGAPIDALARVLGLSHSGAVRLVDRLATDGLLERGAASDGRAVALRPTPAGEALADRVLAARREVLERALAPLSAEERGQLGGLLARMLAGLTEDRAAARRICRLCEIDTCHHRGTCPVTAAADAAQAA